MGLWYMWWVDQNVTCAWLYSVNNPTGRLGEYRTSMQKLNAPKKRQWWYSTKWQDFWHHCIQPEGDYYQEDKYEITNHADPHLHPKLYCDYFIWYVSCTVVDLTCFVMCVCSGNMCARIYCVFVLLSLCIFILFKLVLNFVKLCIFIVMFMYSHCYVCSVLYILFFIVPTGTLWLPWLRFFRGFSSVVRHMPGYNSQRRGTAHTLPTLTFWRQNFFF